jgi:hypothetical protein
MTSPNTPNIPKVSGPVAFALAAVGIAALATIVALVYLGQDLTAVGVFIGAILTALGIQQATTKKDVAEVKTQTNGNNQRLVDALLASQAQQQELLQRVLLSLPPGSLLPPLAPPAADPPVLTEDRQ